MNGTDEYSDHILDDKVDLNTRFNSLDRNITSEADYETYLEWNDYLIENGYFDNPHEFEWNEQKLSDAIKFGERLI